MLQRAPTIGEKRVKMAVRIVLGTQWGDEGKGKIVDILTEDSDIVVRYQGGANAGHTVVIDNEKFILHLVPTGILHPKKICILGNGVVVDLEQLFSELQELKERGIETDQRVLISDSAHLVMPYHKTIERLDEKQKGKNRIGTTCKGIGPAYADKIGRIGIRMMDLLDEELFNKKLEQNFKAKEVWFKMISKKEVFSLKKKSISVLKYKNKIKPLLIDASIYLNEAIKKRKNILLESAQGTLLDVDFGTYPYVTSSHPTAGGACIGSGIGPTRIDEVIGVTKAYTTRVGDGPFPTELNDTFGEILRKKGNEFGATTGRPRRCGWLDLVILKHSVRVNALDKLAITKLDVLDQIEPILVCVGYKYKNKKIEGFPKALNILWNVEPIYKEFSGWKNKTCGLTNYKDLPDKTKRYLEFIEKSLDVPIFLISTGFKREEAIFV